VLLTSGGGEGLEWSWVAWVVRQSEIGFSGIGGGDVVGWWRWRRRHLGPATTRHQVKTTVDRIKIATAAKTQSPSAKSAKTNTKQKNNPEMTARIMTASLLDSWREGIFWNDQ
jgi:hypothetical protein